MRLKSFYYISLLIVNVAVVYIILKYTKDFAHERNRVISYQGVTNAKYSQYIINQTHNLLANFVAIKQSIKKTRKEGNEGKTTKEKNPESNRMNAEVSRRQVSVPTVKQSVTTSRKIEIRETTGPQKKKDFAAKTNFLKGLSTLETRMSFEEKQEPTTILPIISGLNAHVWFLLCAKNVTALCKHPLFPSLPDVRTYVHRLELKRDSKNFVQRIFGFILPPSTGNYRFGISSDDSSELWLSTDTEWQNSRLLCNVGTRDKPSQSLKSDSFKSFPTQFSTEVHLRQGCRYYIEILHTELGDGNFLHVTWQKPGDKVFEIIDGNSTALYVRDQIQHGESHIKQERVTLHLGPVCGKKHVNIQQHVFPESQIYQCIAHEAISHALPYCDYKPSYTSFRKRSSTWEFIWPPIRHDTYVFPYFEFPEGVVYTKYYPANRLPEYEAKKIVIEYMKKLKAAYSPRKLKLLSIFNVERKLDEKKGSRYLIEAKFQIQGSEQESIVSEYVFKHSSNGSLCYPRGLQWKRNANIALIITLKNQGNWMLHFLNNLEHIYRRTQDKRVTLIVYDFNSTDIDVESALKDRTIPPYKLVKGSGDYSRSRSINAAVKQLKDPQTIIFTVDLHLDLPISLFDDIRKHCFEGLSVYTPVLLRLRCGETSFKPKGRWESHGFGIIGIYKSDWDRIGGLDELRYNKKWGGEDWDFMERLVSNRMEYERLRNTQIFHYAHSRKGMWSGDPDIVHIPIE